MRKKFCLLFITVLSFLLPAHAITDDISTAKGLTQRLIPNYADNFQFKKIKSNKGKDCFELESKEGKIIISGNNANAMAMALKYYLQNYCLTTVSWYADIPVQMPTTLPMIEKKIAIHAKVDDRFFINYCTYGYTMPYWQWPEWERFIDWMALNGINLPLAITGQEAVWYNVWKDLGMSDEAIRTYFTGPSYLPWHRMANIDGWGGPLPKQWLDNQVALQKKILERERAFNMKPVLPAFAGHVPGALKSLYPQADIKYLGKWASFDDKYRCHFLNPEDPLFAKIQKNFLQEQTRLFGTDHIYGADPFNEVEPPSWEPAYLKTVAKNMYQTMAKVDPKAKWMQMTWIFYYDSKHWTAPRIKAYLEGIPTDQSMLLDYHCENVELWQKTERFYNQPYIWCYLGNFGGNTSMTGNVKQSGTRLENTLLQGGKNFKGVGSTLEGLDVMQFPYEYVFEKAWSFDTPDTDWINQLADRHAGVISQPVRQAWQILFNQIYTQVPKTWGILPSLRPGHAKTVRRTTTVYPDSLLWKVWGLLLQAPDCNRDAMKLDIIVSGRQVLGNYFKVVKMRFDQAAEEKNIAAMKAAATEMKELLADIDALNAFHTRCSLNTWINEARRLGNTPQLKDYYEKDARNLITTWGGSLNDYANRSWAGLTKDYYAKRWELYIETMFADIHENKTFNQEAFNQQMTLFELNWVNSKDRIEVVPGYDLKTFATLLYHKYTDRIN